MSVYVAEYLGTLILVLLGDGIVAGILLSKSKAQNAGWIAITIGWGLSVAIAIYAVGEFSGAHINPAVTLGLAMQGSFSWNMVPGYMLAQFAGAFTGAVLVWLHYGPHWKHTEDAGLKLAVFCTGPAIRKPIANLFSEFLATTVLIVGLLMIGANRFAEGLNPLVVGGLITVIGLALGGTTGFAINPARDLGPRIAHFLLPIPGKGHSDWAYSWIPVVGPLMGAAAGAIIYNWLF